MRSEGKEELTTCEYRLVSGLEGIQACLQVFKSDVSDEGEAQRGRRDETPFFLLPLTITLLWRLASTSVVSI